MLTFSFLQNFVYPFLIGAFAGLVYVALKGHYILPRFKKSKLNGVVLELGFLSQVIVGGGAGIAAANTLMQNYLVAGIFLAGFSGGIYLIKNAPGLGEEVVREVDKTAEEIEKEFKKLKNLKG